MYIVYFCIATMLLQTQLHIKFSGTHLLIYVSKIKKKKQISIIFVEVIFALCTLVMMIYNQSSYFQQPIPTLSLQNGNQQLIFISYHYQST